MADQASRSRELDRELADELDEAEPVGGGTSSGYLRDLGRRPRLSAQRERELVAAAQAGDRAARAELVEAFLPLVSSVARLYRGTSVERIELVQEGVVGLLRALERYDPQRGAAFWTYASWWVRQAMQQLVAELTRPVVLSDRALRQLARVKDAHREHLREHGREPSPAQLAEDTGLSREQVADLIAADRAPRGLQEPVQAGEDGVGTFGELLADPLAEDEYEAVADRVAAQELRSLLSGLSERERTILRARYGAGEGQSLRDIAARLGMSAERVRQLEARALGKLRLAARGA